MATTSLLTTINTGMQHDSKPVLTEYIEETNKNSIKNSVNTGFTNLVVLSITNTSPVTDISPITFKESIKETIDSGFGDGVMHVECETPSLVRYLTYENHLSEFKTETDKALARQNLDVYSSGEVNSLILSIVNNNGSLYITKVEVQKMIDLIEYVDSSLKSYANYDIPKTLFKL